MKPEEVLKHYKSIHYFRKYTGMSASSLWNWLAWGRIPIKSQLKLQQLSKGALKANLADDSPEYFIIEEENKK
jgi:hypothetical protein